MAFYHFLQQHVLLLKFLFADFFLDEFSFENLELLILLELLLQIDNFLGQKVQLIIFEVDRFLLQLFLLREVLVLNVR